MKALRIVVHDYAGHPFQVELSRALAARGHTVQHLYCSAYVSGKGDLRPRSSDPSTFSCRAVPLGRFDKHSPLRRARQEVEYGRALAGAIRRFAPDVVLSANTPLFAQGLALRTTRRSGGVFIYWLQDIIGVAALRFLDGRIPLGRGFARLIARLERSLLRKSDAVVAISPAFEAAIGSTTFTTIENWAPLDELPVLGSDNNWAREHALDGKRVFLYSGTLGLKHNPELLAALAREFKGDAATRVVVVSEGAGADYLTAARSKEQLDALVVLPFQPFDRLPEVMAAATVLVAILERDAGAFSVPSKVLSYLCAGRPILAAMPAENLAAQIVVRAGAGVVVDPDDAEALGAAARALACDPEQRRIFGRAARCYAERTFDIKTVAGRFEHVIYRATPSSESAPPSIGCRGATVERGGVSARAAARRVRG